MPQRSFELPYKYEPRWYQEPVWDALFDTGSEMGRFDTDIRRAFCLDHRRSGKDLNFFNLAMVKMHQRVGLYIHIFPTLTEGRRVIWNGMTRDGRRFLDYVPGMAEYENGDKAGWVRRKREDEMSIKVANGSVYMVLGADHPDSVRGIGPLGCIFSEYAFFKGPDLWDIVRPMLAESDGWAAFVTTPNGRNHSHALHMMAENNPLWYTQTLRASFTKIKGLSDRIEEDRKSGMSEEKIAAEYECSYDAAVDGAFYGKQMTQAYADGRIGKVPYNENLPVDTYWDIGVADPTAVWFAQQVGPSHHLIDFEWATGFGMNQLAQMISGQRVGDNDYSRKKQYKYRHHFGPHDLAVREIGADYANSRIASAAKLGLRFRVVPRGDLEDGRNAVRALLSTSYFDEEHCRLGIDALSQYQRKPMEGGIVGPDGKKMYSNDHVHNWASHGADAFRTGASGRKIFYDTEYDYDPGELAPEIAMI